MHLGWRSKHKANKDSKSAAEGEHARGVQRLGPQLERAARPPAANQALPPQGNNLPRKKVTRDLWNEAFALLSQEECDVLRPADRDGKPGDLISQQGAVENVIKLTEVKYKEFCRRGWHTGKGDTIKETNVRIKAKEIMCSALQFKDIVDAGLKFDPSGYGTIVWGVLSGVLTLVQNDKEKVDAVFDSAAVMARFLPKYAIIEHHYRDRTTQEQNAFENLIQEVYVAILKYAAYVQKGLSQSVAGRLLDSFWTLDNQEVKTLEVELEGKDEIVTSQSQFMAHQYRKQEFEELDGKASETLSKIDESVEILLKDKRLKTLDWLSRPGTDKQQQLRDRVGEANNSGKWLLESKAYTDWLTESHSSVWLYGASGCGKSILCSTVVKSLEESAEKNSNVIVAYWYIDIADPLSQNLQRLLRFVLRRISAKATPFPEVVRDLEDKHQLPDSSPSTTALIKTLTETVTALEEDIFLVLDAIDEYQTSNKTLREEFLNLLVKLSNAQMQKLHLLVTSTADTDIVNAFKRLQEPPVTIDVERPVSIDVDAYLDAKINKYAEEKHWSPEITDKIYKALKYDGRFRIVSLQLADLYTCYSDDEIDAALESIPHDIEVAYQRKLQSVAPKDIRRLSHIFYWISVAVRQLTTFELAAAPGVNLPNPEDLTNICPRGMIRLEKRSPSDVDELELLRQKAQKSSGTETEIVTFDHPSVKRFLYSSKLQQSGDGISPFFVSEKTVNAEFASLMVDHLLAIKQPRIEPSIFVTSPFLPYVAQHWHEHLKDRGDVAGEDEVLKANLLILFGEPMNPAYLNWVRVWNPDSKKPDFGLAQDSCPSPLYVAVLLRFEGISKHLIDNRSYINSAGGLMHTTLQLALRQEYTEIAQELIAAGEDVDRTAKDQPTALYTAVQGGNAELVQMLLAAGAEPEAGDAPFGPALQLASFQGFTKIVELLVASKADVNLLGGRFGTALQAAAAAGHSEVVAILLQHGAKPDVVGGLLGTAIQAAATGGHSKVVKMLAAEDIAWDKKRDSIWHDAYELWKSRSPQNRYPWIYKSPETGTKSSQSFFSGEWLVRSNNQQILASVLETLSSLPAANSKAFATRRLSTKQLQLLEQVRRQGSEGMESEYYVYRALFWVMLFRGATSVQGFDTIGSGKKRVDHDIEETLYRLGIIIFLRASDQKMIEHGTSDALEAARHELVEYYALAFQVVIESETALSRSTPRAWYLLGKVKLPGHVKRLLASIEEQNTRFELVMKTARLQEPSPEAALLDPMHRELLAKMQQEMHGHFQMLEEGMQKRLEEVEQRVVASVRDILPGIIREEMRKLLLEQKGSAGLDDRG